MYFKHQQPEIIIHAKRAHETYELIPPEIFDEDFPVDFVEKYSHWLQLSSCSDSHLREIEFRPLNNVWSPSADNWRLVFSSSISTSSMRMRCGNIFLVDVQSPTFKMVSSKLASLEVPKHIHVTTDITSTSSEPKLYVSLARFKLSFFLNASGEMESMNFRDMVIDSDQSTGTMVGLESQLVLRQKGSNVDPFRARSVIIPFGDVKSNMWPKITIGTSEDTEEQSSVRYFKYDIDTILRSLVSVTLLADLYKIYLHAITSHPCPDPLTGRTGTEEALTSLLSAKCFSFQTLGIEEQEILYKIAKLSPKRVWYPKHLKVMQSTIWGTTGPLGQHDDFHRLVDAILKFHDRLEIFKKESKYCADKLPTRDDHLQQRSGSRNYNLFASDYAGRIPTPSDDDNYFLANRPHRSSTPSKKVVQLAANVSAMVQGWQSLLPTVTDLWKRIVSLEKLSCDPEDGFSLSYSNELSRNFRLQNLWLSLYNQCRRRKGAARFALTFTLSVLSYRLSDDLQVCQLLPTFLAFATRPEFSCIDPPPWDSYDLRIGTQPDTDRLHTLVMEHVIPYSEFQLTCNSHETSRQFENGREYLSQCSSHASVLLEEITSQWPCPRPSWSIVSNARPDLISLSSKLKNCIDDLFQQWHSNLEFRDHIYQVQLVLDHARSDSSHDVPPTLGKYEHPISYTFKRMPRYSMPSLNDLLSRRKPSSPQQQLDPLSDLLHQHEKENDDHNSIDLKHLFEEFIGDNNSVRRKYGKALDSSWQSRDQSREQGSNIFKEIPSSLGVPELEIYRNKCGHQFSLTLTSIVDVLSPSSSLPTELLGYQSGQWPRITLALLLGLLSETSKYDVPLRWKSAIVLLAQSLMRYQRAQRLLHFRILGALEDFSKEFNNDLIPPEQEMYPEWLLIQVSII